MLAMSISCRRRSAGRAAFANAAAAVPERGRPPPPPPPPPAARRLPCAMGRMSREKTSLAPALPVDACDWESGTGPSSTPLSSLGSAAPDAAAVPTRRRLRGTCPAAAPAGSRLVPRGTPGRRRVAACGAGGTNSSEDEDDDDDPSLLSASATARPPRADSGRRLPSRRLRDGTAPSPPRAGEAPPPSRRRPARPPPVSASAARRCRAASIASTTADALAGGRSPRRSASTSSPPVVESTSTADAGATAAAAARRRRSCDRRSCSIAADASMPATGVALPARTPAGEGARLIGRRSARRDGDGDRDRDRDDGGLVDAAAAPAPRAATRCRRWDRCCCINSTVRAAAVDDSWRTCDKGSVTPGASAGRSSRPAAAATAPSARGSRHRPARGLQRSLLASLAVPSPRAAARRRRPSARGDTPRDRRGRGAPAPPPSPDPSASSRMGDGQRRRGGDSGGDGGGGGSEGCGCRAGARDLVGVATSEKGGWHECGGWKVGLREGSGGDPKEHTVFRTVSAPVAYS